VGQSGDDKELDRRHFLQCMAWLGTGAVWTVSSGILKGTPLGQSRGGAMMPHAPGGLRFVQISDSHIGFDKPANTDVTATLHAGIEKIKADPEPPSFVLHTGDLTHLSKASEFDALQQILSELSMPVFYVRASTMCSRTTAGATCSDSGRGRWARGGTDSTTAACTSSAWSTS
jgi:hypothetical protein